MRHEVSVIVPCYNEAQNIPELASRLQNVFTKKLIEGEVILVNDGSHDTTGEVIDGLAKQYENLTVVHHAKNQGVAEAWKTGLANSKGEYICLIDADLQYQPEDVHRLYREIKFSNVDMVQGVRSSIGHLKEPHFVLNRGFNVLLNFLFSMDAKDSKSGFVLCRREVLEDILRYRFRYFYFQSLIRVATKVKGYSVRDIETLFESRLLGKSFISRFPVRAVLLGLVDLIKAFLEFRLFYKPDMVLEEYLKHNPPERYEKTLTGWRRQLFGLFVLTMPLHKWLISRQAGRYYRELKRSQWLKPEQITQLQEIKLRKLIHHAYHHVPYYRELFLKLGLKPSDIRTLNDLTKLPLLSKNDVRSNLYDLLSDNHNKKKVLRVTTSGSTGEPFVCFADKHQLEGRWAATQRSLEWTGYRFGDRQARLWHQTIGMGWSQIIYERLDTWFNRRLFIPAFDMDNNSIRNFVQKLVKFKPVLIDGYAEAFNFLAHYIKNNGLPNIKPKALMSSAQMLPDQSRKIIEDSFQTKVFDKYGSREFSGIAYECEAHDGHHVVAESYIVEILKGDRPAKPNEIGEVVVTDINNYCMPLIRYRIGDLVTAMDSSQPCACGRGLPRIGKIEGRVQAIIVGDNGRYVPGTFFAHLFKDYDYIIRQYKIIQEERGKIDFYVVKGARFSQNIFENEILRNLYNVFGCGMQINLKFVDKIPMVRTGKQQGSISKIKFDFQDIKFTKQDSL